MAKVTQENKCWRKVVRRNGDIYFQTDLDKPFYEQKSVSVSKRQMAGEKKVDYVVFSSDEGRGFNLGEFKSKQEALKIAHKEIQKLKRCS
jgi:hypothetical protein